MFDVAKHYVTAMVTLTLLACLAYLWVTMRRDWRATYASKAVVYRTMAFTLVIGLILAARLWGEYWNRIWFQIIVYTCAGVSAVYLTYIAYRNPDEENKV